MTVRWVTGFLDGPSRDGEGFWRAVTGSGLSPRRGPGGEFATLVPADGDAYLRVQVVGDGPARSHLDLHVEDVPGAAARARALGASVWHDEGDLVVLRSPAGVMFCLVPWHGEAVVPGPGEHGGRVDRLEVVVPGVSWDAEVGFWAAVTGWARRPGSGVLGAAAGMPLRLVVRASAGGPVGVRVVVAAVDRGAEVGRHVGLGAVPVREGPGWTALRDPVGREYRVTDAD